MPRLPYYQDDVRDRETFYTYSTYAEYVVMHMMKTWNWSLEVNSYGLNIHIAGSYQVYDRKQWLVISKRSSLVPFYHYNFFIYCYLFQKCQDSFSKNPCFKGEIRKKKTLSCFESDSTLLPQSRLTMQNLTAKGKKLCRELELFLFISSLI